MAKKIIYFIGGKKYSAIVNNETAEAIQRRLETEPEGSMSIGKDYVPIKSIKGITDMSEHMNDEAKGIVLRRTLNNAAASCFGCYGIGFTSRSSDAMCLCECQTKVKRIAGVDPDDYAWHNGLKDGGAATVRKMFAGEVMPDKPSVDDMRAGMIRATKAALEHVTIKNLWPWAKNVIDTYAIAPEEVGLSSYSDKP